MPDPADFDARLAAALDRYVERAPHAPNIVDVAETAMGSDGSGARRWWFPDPRPASLILLLGLLLLALLAAALGAGGRLFPRDALGDVVPSPAASGSPPPSPAPSGPVIGEGERWIAYMAPFGGRLIDAVRPDGTGRHTLFPFVPGGEQQHPDWSADGHRLVFSVVGTATQTIWVGDADGSNASSLVDCQLPCRWVDEPAWSPDSRLVAYQRMVSRDGVAVSTIEIIDMTTRQQRVVYTAAAGHAVYAPRWSGDGIRLVFESVSTASSAVDADVTADALAVLDVTTATPSPRQIIAPDLRCNNPDWSWVTDLILCTKPTAASGFDGPADLYTLRPDGTEFRPLTDIAATGGIAIKPTWLPDGSGAIFCDPDGAMRTVRADGTGLAPAISQGSILGLHPRVRPTP